MKVHPQTQITGLVAEAIRARLRAGDRTPELDDLTIDLHNAHGLSLAEATGLVEGRLAATLKLLHDKDQIVGTRVTDHYLVNYKGQTPDHPASDGEVALSVAGLGGAEVTAGLHFCDGGDNCVLAIGRAVHGLDSGIGASKAETARVQTEKTNGVLDGDGVAEIAARTGTDRQTKSLPAQIK